MFWAFGCIFLKTRFQEPKIRWPKALWTPILRPYAQTIRSPTNPRQNPDRKRCAAAEEPRRVASDPGRLAMDFCDPGDQRPNFRPAGNKTVSRQKGDGPTGPGFMANSGVGS